MMVKPTGCWLRYQPQSHLRNVVATIDASYATGAVTGIITVGGLIGGNNAASPAAAITDSYWDIQTSGLTSQYECHWADDSTVAERSADRIRSHDVEHRRRGVYRYLSWQFSAGTTS